MMLYFQTSPYIKESKAMALCNTSLLSKYHYPLMAAVKIETWATSYLFAVFGVGGDFI